KLRMTATGKAREKAEWSIITVSAGESTAEAHIRSGGGKRQTGGQKVRFLDIPAYVGRYGIFESIPDQFKTSDRDFTNSKLLADTLRTNAKTYYGTALREFL